MYISKLFNNVANDVEIIVFKVIYTNLSNKYFKVNFRLFIFTVIAPNLNGIYTVVQKQIFKKQCIIFL